MHMPKTTTWHLVTSGVITPDLARETLSFFQDHLPGWNAPIKNPIAQLGMIETTLVDETPLPDPVVDLLIALTLRWAWLRKGPCIKNARVYIPEEAVNFHPEGNRMEETRMVSYILNVHTWPSLRAPQSAHETLEAHNQKAKAAPLLCEQP